MNDLTWIAVIIVVIVVCILIIRIVGAIVSWRLVLAVLVVVIGATTGVLTIGPILSELDYAITNLFGTPVEGSNP